MIIAFAPSNDTSSMVLCWIQWVHFFNEFNTYIGYICPLIF